MKQGKTVDTSDLRYWLALINVRDIGPASIKRLLAAFKSPEGIFNATLAEICDVQDIREAQARNIKEFDSWDLVEREIQKINRHDIKVMTFNDDDYPEPLRRIDSPPMLLYLKGLLKEDDKFSVAIVGSRLMTEYGKRVAEKIASELAGCGLTIISGMAKGIDTASHKGALKAGGRSIAVLGCGLDRPYPHENVELFRALSKSGCVLSEFPMGTPPNKENFPRRNRLISGLSLGVLVVEATRESGSLITANYALEQNKEVFAVPGNITSKISHGTNDLIKKGAKLVQDVKDILEELHPHLMALKEYALRSASGNGQVRPAPVEMTDEEKKVFGMLGTEPIHIDNIARRLGLPSHKLLGLLLDLEIKGIVRQTEGKKFCII